VIAAYDDYRTATEDRRANCQAWRDDLELLPIPTNVPWTGASGLSSPLATIYKNAHHARLNQQIIQTATPFTCVAQDQEAVDAAGTIEEVLTSKVEESRWPIYADQVHDELTAVGNCGVHTSYEVKTKRVPDIEISYEPDDTAALMAAGTEPIEAIYGGLKTDRQGRPKRRLAFKNVQTFDGVRMRVIPFEDFVIMPATIREPEEAYGIGERVRIRGSALRAGVKEGRYLEDAVEALLDLPSDGVDEDRQVRLDQSGLDGQTTDLRFDDGDRNKLKREYDCLEVDWLDDYNGDGEEEWGCLTVHIATQRLLRAQYLPYDHGLPGYQLFRYYTRPRELFGMGVPEKLACIQDAFAAVLNQLINHEDLFLNLNGNFAYDPRAGFDPSKHELRLGTPIPIEEPDRNLKVLQVPPLSPEHYQLYEILKGLADLITATSNVQLGKETSGQKTLGEVQLFAAASNMQSEEHGARVARDWAEWADRVRWLVAQYGEGGMVTYRTVAAPGKVDFPAPIPAEMLRARVDFVPSALAQLSDMQSRVQRATIVRQQLLTDPVVTTLMQSGFFQVPLMALRSYLQELRVPDREKIMDQIESDLVQMVQAMAAAQAQQEAQMQQMAMDENQAQTAGAEAGLQAGLANQGMLPPPGEGAPLGLGEPLTPAMPPGNGRPPVGAF